MYCKPNPKTGSRDYLAKTAKPVVTHLFCSNYWDDLNCHFSSLVTVFFYHQSIEQCLHQCRPNTACWKHAVHFVVCLVIFVWGFMCPFCFRNSHWSASVWYICGRITDGYHSWPECKIGGNCYCILYFTLPQNILLSFDAVLHWLWDFPTFLVPIG